MELLKPQVTVIGLGGPAYCGKTTAAHTLVDIIEEYNHRSVDVFSWANELKRIARVEFGWDGEKDDKGRRLLQVIGTEAGRAYDEDIWIRRLCDSLNAHPHRIPSYVIIDDCRFPNEVEWCNKRGFTIRILGRGGLTGVNANHTSDTSFDQCAWTDTFTNDHDLAHMRRQLTRILVDNNIIPQEVLLEA